MALIQTDFSQVAEIEAGSYPAVVSAAEVKTTKDGTGRYVEWTFTVQKSSADKFNGRKLPKYRTMTTGPGAGMLKSLVKTLTGEPAPEGEWDTDVLLNREAYCVVRPQKDNPDYMEIASIVTYEGQDIELAEAGTTTQA